MVGQTYGELTIVHHIAARKVPRFVCQCSCGAAVLATLRELEAGRIVSCGHTSGRRIASTSPRGKRQIRMLKLPMGPINEGPTITISIKLFNDMMDVYQKHQKAKQKKRKKRSRKG